MVATNPVRPGVSQGGMAGNQPQLSLRIRIPPISQGHFEFLQHLRRLSPEPITRQSQGLLVTVSLGAGIEGPPPTQATGCSCMDGPMPRKSTTCSPSNIGSMLVVSLMTRSVRPSPSRSIHWGGCPAGLLQTVSRSNRCLSASTTRICPYRSREP